MGCWPVERQMAAGGRVVFSGGSGHGESSIPFHSRGRHADRLQNESRRDYVGGVAPSDASLRPAAAALGGLEGPSAARLVSPFARLLMPLSAKQHTLLSARCRGGETCEHGCPDEYPPRVLGQPRIHTRFAADRLFCSILYDSPFSGVFETGSRDRHVIQTYIHTEIQTGTKYRQRDS